MMGRDENSLSEVLYYKGRNIYVDAQVEHQSEFSL